MFRGTTTFAAATALAAVLATPALAQKSADTMRLAMTSQISHLSIYTHPHPEAAPFYKEIYDPLIRFDETKTKFVPWLAKSWKRSADGAAIEFELRDDVKFHDGKKFTSEDVVETVKYSIDPASKMLNQNRYTSWIKGVEASGPYHVRIETLKPTAVDEMRMNISLLILEGELLKSLPDKADYGQKAIGTGPMKLAAFNAGQSVTLERFKDHVIGAQNPVQRVVGIQIPDRQTQFAQLLVGGVDVIRDPTADMVTNAKSNPNLRTTIVPGLVTLYLSLDATNRSEEAKPVTDVRVRRAIMMAINRREMATTLGVAGDKTRTPDAMCLPETAGCKVSTLPPAYDPAGAKKLLAEAGYPDGFEIELVTIPQGRDAAVVIAGYLQAVGIKTRINAVTDAVDLKMRPSGKNPLYIGLNPGQALPDAHLFSQLNVERDVMDYMRDPILTKAAADGLYTLDQNKRLAIYDTMFSRINDQAYMLNLMTLDTAYLHSKDVSVQPGLALNSFSPRLQDLRWAK